MPVWLLALQIALADAPAIVSAIQIAQLPPLTREQMAVLQTAMDAAVARLDTTIEEQFPKKA